MLDSMASKKQLVSLLRHGDLRRVSKHLALEVADGRKSDSLRQAILATRACTVEALLTALTVSTLRRLCDEFGLSTDGRKDDLLARLAKRRKKPNRAKPRSQIPAPVEPQVHDLPLGSISWERFETLCVDLAGALPDAADTPVVAHRYGKRGDDQRGIDVVVTLASGRRRALQCRRWKRYTAKNVRDAIACASYPADEFVLVLACEAQRALRDVIDTHEQWSLWDACDIATLLRSDIAQDDARRIVSAHFGGRWCSAFLGLVSLAPYQSAAHFFGPLLDQARLFHHGWKLTGRDGTLAELANFCGSAEHRVALLPGRGGVGKTRLLRELAQDTRLSVRFATQDVAITPETVADLPTGPCLIVVDDAHRRSDIGVLLAYVRARRDARLLLACRPYARDALQGQIANAGFDVSEVRLFDELSALGREGTARLLEQVDGLPAPAAQRLTRLAWDSPLVALVGGRLIAQGSLPTPLLEREDDFRRTVLTRFRDVLVGTLGGVIAPDLCQHVLQLVAAIGPIRFDDDQFRRTAADFLGVRPHVLTRSLDVLVASGVLLRRGRAGRITPDVLGDHILHTACVTAAGDATGFVAEVFETFGPVRPTELLRNLCELDWRLRQSSDRSPNLLSDVWDSLREEFTAAPNSGRARILEVLTPTAYFQPDRMLAMVEQAVAHPATAPEPTAFARWAKFNHNHVLRHVPNILGAIAHNLEYLPRCCDLLWELGRGDTRQSNALPGEPMRVLTELAAFRPEKPLTFNEQILESVLRWSGAAGAHDHDHSPCEVLDPLLRRTATCAESDGRNFIMSSFVVPAAAVEGLRVRAIDHLVAVATSDHLRAALRAVKSLTEAMWGPHSLGGLLVTDEQHAAWEPDTLRVVDAIQQARTRGRFPLVRVRADEHLRSVAQHCMYESAQRRAADILVAEVEGFSERLAKALVNAPHPAEHDGDIDYEEAGRIRSDARRDFAREFAARYKCAHEAASVIDAELVALATAREDVAPWHFIYCLACHDHTYAHELCERVFADPTRPLASCLSALVSGIRDEDPDAAGRLVRRALDTGVAGLVQQIAHGYAWCAWCARRCADDDVEAIERATQHADENVRLVAIDAVRRLAQVNPPAAAALVTDIDLGGSERLAKELCTVLDRRHGVPLDRLSDEQVERILGRLLLVPEIDGYHVGQFLAAASGRAPKALVELLLARIQHERDGDGPKYVPMPHQGFRHGLQGVARSPQYPALVRRVRDAILAAKPHSAARFWLPVLFREITELNEVALGALDEWVDGGGEAEIEAVSDLLSHARSGFVFARVQWISRLLEAAYRVGAECYRHVASGLRRSARSGAYTRTPGVPSGRLLGMRAAAEAALATLSAASPAHRFYAALRDSAQHNIDHELERDEEDEL
ncbi:MAG: SAP domain-containing protein [Myxococcales bacterium]|nr:SAP domain-containing protein [Myxococcales bacterium]